MIIAYQKKNIQN